jgi:hypothetical protein
MFYGSKCPSMYLKPAAWEFSMAAHMIANSCKLQSKAVALSACGSLRGNVVVCRC